MLKTIKEFFRLVRFEHAIMLAVAVLIGEIVVLQGFPQFGAILIFSLLVPIFSEMGSFALNDYMDVETDRINRRNDRPLVRGTIKPEFAFRFSVFAFLISIFLASLINPIAFMIVFFYNLFAVLYSIKLKDLPVVGNVFIATTMSIPFIFGAVVYQVYPNLTIWILALLGFVSGLAREIVKTVEDMEGDKAARRAKTLPMLIGKNASMGLAAALYLLFIPLSVIPFFSGLHLSIVSGALLLLADAGIAVVALYILFVHDKASMEMTRKYSLVALFLGLFALLAGSLRI